MSNDTERGNPPPAPPLRRVLLALTGAAVVGAVVLVTVVLPAEYGIDPTGAGRVLGLTQMAQPTRTVEIVDIIGGNEVIREVEIPDAGEPVPLPNPAVHQAADEAARTETLTVELRPLGQTELKVYLRAGKVVLYSWHADGPVYTDFHGHDPALGDDFWVRYREHDADTEGHGSLVAPFDGEHGWYWMNLNPDPVTVTLTVHGYHDETVDHGTW